MAKMQNSKSMFCDQMSPLIYSALIESIIPDFPQERVAEK